MGLEGGCGKYWFKFSGWFFSHSDVYVGGCFQFWIGFKRGRGAPNCDWQKEVFKNNLHKDGVGFST